MKSIRSILAVSLLLVGSILNSSGQLAGTGGGGGSYVPLSQLSTTGGANKVPLLDSLGGMPITNIHNLTAPVETLPRNYLVRDHFFGPTFVTTAQAGTRSANPGPGTMTVASLPGVSTVTAGKNSLSFGRFPANGFSSAARTVVHWGAVPNAAGLTMIVRFVQSKDHAYAPTFIGFSTSSSDLVSTYAGAVGATAVVVGGDQPISVFPNPSTVGGGTLKNQNLAALGDLGELVSVAIVQHSATYRTYHVQGGRMGKTFGCPNYSDNWMLLGEETVANIALGTTLYPMISKGSSGTGFLDVREVSVLSSWTHSNRHGTLDYQMAGTGLHSPALVKDPATGLMICSWQSGVAHESADLVINARVRLTNGTWGALQTLVPAFGSSLTTIHGSLSVINGAVWLTYSREINDADAGGQIYRRILTTDTAGVITVGAEVMLNIPEINNHQACPPIQLPATHAYPNRILLPHNEPTQDIKVAYSDDGGTTWTVSHVQEFQGSVSPATGTTIEGTLAIESDGAIACYYRTTTNLTAYYARSTDGGATWTGPVPVWGVKSRGRVTARNMADGSIMLVAGDDGLLRRNITLYKMADNGVILGMVPVGDVAISGTAGTYHQYPNFLEDGKDIVIATSYQGPQGITSLQYNTRQWDNDLALSYELTGGPPIMRESEIRQYEGTSYFRGPVFEDCNRPTYAASIALNARDSNNFVITLTGNLALSINNPLPWQKIRIVLIQDATGSRTLTPTGFVGGPYTLTLSTTANAKDVIEGFYDPQEGEFLVTAFNKGY